MTTKPLGYYLTHIHNGLEQNFAALLGARDLTRRSWQILNTLRQEPADRAGLDRALAHFLDDQEPTVEPHVAALVERGWVRVAADGRYTPTDLGANETRAVAELIDGERAAVVEGLGPDGYDTLVRLLQRVSDNVDAVAAHRR
ncbi:MarR family winged helix-turn-helix transcriptional regulator [Nocardia sp. NPDC051832]|uniref:MarR family winged helix-turn-helix transcriptional regulator n=1 Tax=Nocardia sp. NPDC051832 TaxID=3155673 RepID=UPI003433497D